MEKTSVNEILDFAINAEKAAYRFYVDLSEKMDSEAMSKVFKEFAEQELKHREILEGIKQGKTIEAEEVANLKIADYVVGVEPHPDMTYQDALILAMKREKAAFALYIRIAESTHDQELRKTFEMLAQEEAKHKLYFETEYEEVVLKEN
ncbi:MAG: ferritin family protein [Sedimentisphaerales bacterium]|nr:ferritin family protein [Sedimentisphaerales bacterium]